MVESRGMGSFGVRMSWHFSVVVVMVGILCVKDVYGQIGEIASLAGGLAPGLLGSAGSAAVSGASSLLGNIGTLYQLAQGALQLTGTGVNILNQASEGKWFSAALDGMMNQRRELEDRLLDTESIGPEYSQLGVNFPAPSPNDYDENGEIPIISFPTTTKRITESKEDIITEATTDSTASSSSLVTLFPDEHISSSVDERWIRTVANNSITTEDYDVHISSPVDSYSEQKKKRLIEIAKTLENSNLTTGQLKQIIDTFGKKPDIEKKGFLGSIDTSNQVSRPNILKLPPERSILPSVSHRGLSDSIETEDYDLLPNSKKPVHWRMHHRKILWPDANTLEIVTPTTTNDLLPSTRKYPRRTAYTPPPPPSIHVTSSPFPQQQVRYPGISRSRDTFDQERPKVTGVDGSSGSNFKAHAHRKHSGSAVDKLGLQWYNSRLPTPNRYMMPNRISLRRSKGLRIDSINPHPRANRLDMSSTVLSQAYPYRGQKQLSGANVPLQTI